MTAGCRRGYPFDLRGRAFLMWAGVYGRFNTLVLLLLALMLTGCQGGASMTPAPLPEAAARNANEFLIVDCLLPGQVRKLGQQLTYQTARRPIRTSAVNCEIRGGEYVAYDRADYASALKVWLPKAQLGDAIAQNYVGEIYEKGLGLAPDYRLAAHWYRLAAEQGHAPAQINLGHLSEKGRGVPLDRQAALNWYRQASGLTGDELQFSSTLKAEYAEQERELTTLRSELSERREAQERLEAEVQRSQQQLRARQRSLEDARQQMEQIRRQLEQMKASPGDATRPPTPAVNADLQRLTTLSRDKQALQRQLDGIGQNEAALQRQLEDKQRQLDQLQTQLQRAESELAGHQQELSSTRRELDLSRSQLAQQRQLSAERSVQSEEQARLQQLEQRNGTLQAQQQRYEQQIARSRRQQQRLQQALDDLQTERSVSQQQLQQYREQQQVLQQQLDDKEKRLQAMQQQQRQSDADLAASRARYESELALFTEETQAQRQRRQHEIAALERQLQERRQLVSTQQSSIDELRLEVQQHKRQLTQLTQVEPATMVEPPSIEIIEPPVVLMRGVPSVRLQTPLLEREVIGKVVAPAGLLSFQVNGEAAVVGDNGLFQVKVPIRSDRTPVEIVAVDRQGRRVVAAFSLITDVPAVSKVSGALAAQATRGPELALGNYYALIIGNNQYRHFPSLNTARNDASEAARLLRERYGFKTTLLLDADRYAILSSLNRLRQELTEQDNLLIYYAGHGELDRVNDRGYWLPVDAEPGNSANWISNVDVTDILNAIRAKQVMVVADSCYSGTLSVSSMPRLELSIPEENRNEWIMTLAQVRARTVLTSGGVQPVPDSAGGNHSVFAKAFLDTLNSNRRVLEGHALYRDVLKRVQQRKLGPELQQVPEYTPIHHAGHEAGEFFFRPL